MFATRHLSCSYLLFRLTGLSWPIRGAALFPDLVDKGLDSPVSSPPAGLWPQSVRRNRDSRARRRLARGQVLVPMRNLPAGMRAISRGLSLA